VEVAQQLNRESTMATVTARVALDPVDLAVHRRHGRARRFPFRPAARPTTDASTPVSNSRPMPSSAAPRASVTTRCSPTTRNRRARPRLRIPASRPRSISDIRSSASRDSTAFFRDANYSLYVNQPYYLSTAGALQILQRLFGPFDLDLRGSVENLDYPQNETEAAHLDTANTFAGGLSIRVSSQAVLSLLYDKSERRSPLGPEFGYQRRRVYSTMNLWILK
jgi:hypothetical protein